MILVSDKVNQKPIPTHRWIDSCSIKPSVLKYIFQLLSYILFLTSGSHSLTFIGWFYFASYVLTFSIATFRFSYLCFPYHPQLSPFTFGYWCSFTPVCHSGCCPSCRNFVSAPWGMQFSLSACLTDPAELTVSEAYFNQYLPPNSSFSWQTWNMLKHVLLHSSYSSFCCMVRE